MKWVNFELSWSTCKNESLKGKKKIMTNYISHENFSLYQILIALLRCQCQLRKLIFQAFSTYACMRSYIFIRIIKNDLVNYIFKTMKPWIIIITLEKRQKDLFTWIIKILFFCYYCEKRNSRLNSVKLENNKSKCHSSELSALKHIETHEVYTVKTYGFYHCELFDI